MSYKVVQIEGKYAIVDENGGMVSPDVMRLADDRYLAVKDGNMAIFDSDGNQLTEWQRAEILTGKSTFAITRQADEAKPETSKEETPIQVIEEILESKDYLEKPSVSKFYMASENKWVDAKYYENLGILEIYDREKNSMIIEFTYKNDADLKKGPSAPGI
jgi:outer membrane lipoprotein-sorting protein